MWFRLPMCRSRAKTLNVLFVDDSVPSDVAGAGQPRTASFVTSLVNLGASVTFLPTHPKTEARTHVRSTVPVTVIRSRRSGRVMFKRHGGKADLVIISRPHNMARFLPIWRSMQQKGVRLVYDAEAIFAERERVRHNVLGLDSGPDIERELQTELDLARFADVVLAVSEIEAAAFRAAGCTDVRVLGYASQYPFTTPDFPARHGFLFIGPIHGPDTPNGDSISFFADRIWPAVRKALPGVQLRLAGRPHDSIPAPADGIVKSGAVDDLSSCYAEARVFIAPTRFAAGIPLKVLDAGAAGVPVVMTSLLAAQLGWRHGIEAIVADTEDEMVRGCIDLHSNPAMWLSIQQNALARIRADHTSQKFNDVVRSLI